ncbi:AAA family ATPase [Kaistia defluvii]|uniref:Chloramphenicol 3-O-phosphotransferase n=1 Tax=Kaistia defluvii TaxID=410841 RepID=A0ABV2R7C7_9HYPH
MSQPRLILITGAMAAGKSTVAQAVAEALPKSVHLRGDVFRRMIVNGAAVMGPVLDDEAQAQLRLRHDLACDAARRYHAAGFSVVYQDILIGRHLTDVVARLADLDPRIVVLCPDAATLARRDRERSKTGYGEGFPPDILADALVRETPRIGLWIDSSQMTVGEVVARILAG